MSATHDAVGKIGGVIRSLISALVGEENKSTDVNSRTDWQTTEDRTRSIRRRDLLRRRMEHYNQMISPQKKPETITEEKMTDKI